MNECVKKHNELLGKKLVENLQRRSFDACYVETKEEALAKALELIPQSDLVSWGGCTSAQEIGLLEAIKKRNRYIDRDEAKTPQENTELRRQGLLADSYILGTNAVSLDGQLVNVDGMGNRVAALCFGPKQVIVLCGINKICKTVEAAQERARNVAAPTNAQRFTQLDSPCKQTGSCGNCLLQTNICSQIVITRMSKPAGRIKVIVVGENLGF